MLFNDFLRGQSITQIKVTYYSKVMKASLESVGTVYMHKVLHL